ncbi:unnamed protein product [Rotaria socialis]|uniref:Uncharacterized protein n=1 Tax=Rotaria socialis TaxID=392032 RepID=A0A818VIL3_9BILA|nr:unnamed protein product [Rotaria socialis]CAF4686919.1 unnamed protein product [Rotaria socialis]
MEAKKQIAFVEYFENEWLNSHNTWYENIQHFTPSTNDGLESFNKIIKDENTYRERIPLSRFRIITFETVKQWSSQYKHKLKQYIQTPSITLDIWTKGYQWAKSDKSVISMNHGYTVEYYAPADDEFKISNNDIDTINTMKWNTFDQYRKRAFNVWYIKMQNDPTNWMKG